MIADPFYHNTVAKTIMAFGSLFSGMSIDRETKDKSKTKRVPIPLTYGPREKVLELVRGNPDHDRSVATILPRIAFEMTSLMYDPSRKLPKTTFITLPGDTVNTKGRLWSPVPYTMVLDMDIIVKYQEDGLQIVEQILPFFQPDLEITIFDVPGNPFSRDVPIVLTSSSVADEYESGIDTKRIITWSLSFEAKLFLYRPVDDGKIIKKVDVTLSQDITLDTWLEQYTAAIDPFTANEDEPHTIAEEWKRE